jgi:hypothetical protein
MREGDIIQDGPWAGAEVISVYTRAQAIEDGVLADVTETASQSGFKVPVALTASVFAIVEPNDEEEAEGQSSAGRLHDLLWMAYLYARGARTSTEGLFETIFVMRNREGYRNGDHVQKFRLHSGPGDEGEHVIMLPEED